jgi:hypothetical protein
MKVLLDVAFDVDGDVQLLLAKGPKGGDHVTQV